MAFLGALVAVFFLARWHDASPRQRPESSHP